MSDQLDLDFNQALSIILGLVGKLVSVWVGAADGDPPMVLTATGTLKQGTELTPDDPAPEEAIYLTCTEDLGAGFFLHCTAFKGAREVQGGVHLQLGSLVLQVTEAE